MSKNQEIHKLKAKRKQAIDSIYRIKRFIIDHDDDENNENKLQQFEVRREMLQESFRKIQDVQCELECLDKKYEETLDDLESEYLEILVHINSHLSKDKDSTHFSTTSSVVLPAVSSSNGGSFSSKLPSIDIPSFDGKKLTSFKPFVDIFTAVIDKNSHLRDVEKLFYLKSYLKGEPLSLINNLPLTNSSYKEAFQILNNRYNNETLIVNSHINALLDIPNIHKGTVSSLREFLSKVKQELSSLKNLKQPVDSWDMILICILTKKLDQFTNRSYQIDRDSSKLPTLEEFLTFLEKRATALETVSASDQKSKEKLVCSHTNAITDTKTKFVSKCLFCSLQGHKIYTCKKFISLPVSDRISFIDKHKICAICLNKHLGKCKMSFKCSICQREHNVLLHLDRPSGQFFHDSSGSSRSEHKVINFGSVNAKIHSVLLPTVRVKVGSGKKSYITIRGLLDTGSQISLIKKSTVEKLKLKPFNNFLCVFGISKNNTKIQNSVNVNIKSCIYDYSTNIKCAVIDTITDPLPQTSFNISDLNFPKNITLSDDQFNESQDIEILLGADICFQVLLSDKFNLGTIIVQNTLLGFVVSGSIPFAQFCHMNALHNTLSSLDSIMSQFWETEKVPEIFPEYSSEQEACEINFQNSLQIVNGKFQVSLPLKQDINDINLGDSFSVALKRFENLEKRFKANPNLFEQYKLFIHEYLNLNHAKILDINLYDLENDSVYFMAHHPVIREDKRTTKLRVVFDGSMKTKSKKCLNDFLYNGAVVQKELFDILILFRTYKFVILADIKQMYRMVLVHPEHRKLQNILWREPGGPLQCVQLQTVTYGVRSSAFLSTRCLVELAQKEGKQFPLAAQALLNNTYIDDIHAGCDTIEQTVQLKNELISLLNLRGFELHKWGSNNDEILHDIPYSKRNLSETDMSANNFIVKTLGLTYDVKVDAFKLSATKIELNECVTKRQVLSCISKFYDPLGFAGPVVVSAKLIMQKLWICKLKWDDVLPKDLLECWHNFINSLNNMPVLIIHRNLNFANAIHLEIIGFCDASLSAYGAVLYIRAVFSDKVKVSLICSKSRIVPINKKITVPRLELNSALLLSKLAKRVYDLLSSKINKVILYSDSNIVLAWIKSQPTNLNPYVANRIIKINEFTNHFDWFYINTKQNPADCLSRGLDPQEISTKTIWFNGPEKFSDKHFKNDKNQIVIAPNLPEQKITVHLSTSTVESFFINFSNLRRLQRVVGYILRFFHNATNKENRLTGNLKLNELEFAFKAIIKHEQKCNFFEEINSLTSKKCIKSNLISLSPFLDHEGIMRVGGRLQNSDVEFSKKHPIILPKNNHVTDLLIREEHLKLLHAGPRLILSSLQQNFWIISGYRQVKKVISKCIICFKHKAKCSEQLMGSLPEKRVSRARVFQNVGIDFCGPFLIKQSRIRKSITSKCYIALFICFAVKAIHMELLSDLTTENFLAAFKRFISRRGRPSTIFCDNGATFKGAKNQLDTMFRECTKIENFFLDEKINFKFIPSYSPVFGGLWEAGVKSAKHHLKKIMGNNVLTYEELNTLIIQIEGILNSRPLTPISNDPSDDLDYLTPGHFLIGSRIDSFPEPDLIQVPQNRLKFWRVCTQMQQHFWQRWHRDYLTQCQNRPKWKKDLPNLKEGMLVLLKDENVPSFKWRVARITKVIPGKDEKVRVVEVRTQNGTYLRSVTKIAVLPGFD